MSARCVFTLLVVVALSLLLTTGSALSRPDLSPRDACVRLGEVGTGTGGGPDNSDPGGFTPGDDDVWDKPIPGDADSKFADVFGVDGRTGNSFSSERSVQRYARMAIWLRLVLRSWVIVVGTR
jgi:hypothetical protein